MPDAKSHGLLGEIVMAFTSADFDRIPLLVQQGIDSGLEPHFLLDDGLVSGIREVGEQFRRGDVYLPEMMLAAEAWQDGMNLLEPLLAGQPTQQVKGKVVIGTVKGDIHSLGKNIVITLLKTAGYEVFDLGVDVPASKFVAKAAETHADIIAVCALMTTTMPQQKEVIEHLFAANKRDDFFVMVGGACTTEEWASQIKADAYGATAADAVALADDYVQRRKRN
jgi:corrinoid protein of di/trimethylamine methyltransferase